MQSAKSNKINIKLLLSIVLYAVLVVFLTFNPFNFSLAHLKNYLQNDIGHILWSLTAVEVWDVIGNVMMFMPLGIWLYLKENKEKQKKRCLWKMFFIPFAASLFIEITQLFLSRHTSLMDVLSNTAGGALGYWLAKNKLALSFDSSQFHGPPVRPLLRHMFISGYFVLYFLLMFLLVKMNHLKAWDDMYPLLIGNEATENRPWNGTIKHLAIYDKAIIARDAERITVSGLPGQYDPFYLWDFDEIRNDTIRSKGKALHPVSFYAGNFLNDSSGIKVENSILKSDQPVYEWISSILESGEFSVEVIFKTDDVSQSGPARIVSLSRDTDHRNFTLGQQDRRLHFRTRTPMTGPNGSIVSLKTEPLINENTVHHVIAVFNNGVMRLFFDGNPAKASVRIHEDFLQQFIKVAENRFGTGYLFFMLLFPMAFLDVWFSGRPRIASGFSKTLLAALLVEFYFVFQLGASVSVFFLVISFLAAFSGSVSGRVLHPLYR